MASLAKATQNYWRTMVLSGSIGGGSLRTFASSPSTTATNFVGSRISPRPSGSNKPWYFKGEFVPVYVALGLIILQLSIGFHTIKQQLYAPGVYVKKKRRETFPEVEDPDYVLEYADGFLRKSFFRKVGAVQMPQSYNAPEPHRKEVLAGARRAETLKSVGVEPAVIGRGEVANETSPI